MTFAAPSRYQAISSSQVIMLMEQLRVHAGIKIESPQSVIEGNIRNRMTALGVDDLGAYLAAFDDSINARAEWLALIAYLGLWMRMTKLTKVRSWLNLCAEKWNFAA